MESGRQGAKWRSQRESGPPNPAAGERDQSLLSPFQPKANKRLGLHADSRFEFRITSFPISSFALTLRNFHARLDRECGGFFVSRVHVPGDSDSGVVGQHAIQALGHFGGSVGDGHLSRVRRVVNIIIA